MIDMMFIPLPWIPCLRRSTANSRSNSKRIQSAAASVDSRRRSTGKQH